MPARAPQESWPLPAMMPATCVPCPYRSSALSRREVKSSAAITRPRPAECGATPESMTDRPPASTTDEAESLATIDRALELDVRHLVVVLALYPIPALIEPVNQPARLLDAGSVHAYEKWSYLVCAGFWGR